MSLYISSDRIKTHPTPSSLAPAFLEKLYELLSDEAGNQEYIAWQPNGASFLIKQPIESFCNYVLPKYFKHNNLQSFVRQLNMYDFSKTSHDSNHREFTHTLFRKGRRDLLPLIKRKISNTKISTHPTAIGGSNGGIGGSTTGTVSVNGSIMGESSKGNVIELDEFVANSPRGGYYSNATSAIASSVVSEHEQYHSILDKHMNTTSNKYWYKSSHYDYSQEHVSDVVMELQKQVQQLQLQVFYLSDCYEQLQGEHQDLLTRFDKMATKPSIPTMSTATTSTTVATTTTTTTTTTTAAAAAVAAVATTVTNSPTSSTDEPNGITTVTPTDYSKATITSSPSTSTTFHSNPIKYINQDGIAMLHPSHDDIVRKVSVEGSHLLSAFGRSNHLAGAYLSRQTSFGGAAHHSIFPSHEKGLHFIASAAAAISSANDVRSSSSDNNNDSNGSIAEDGVMTLYRTLSKSIEENDMSTTTISTGYLGNHRNDNSSNTGNTNNISNTSDSDQICLKRQKTFS